MKSYNQFVTECNEERLKIHENFWAKALSYATGKGAGSFTKGANALGLLYGAKRGIESTIDKDEFGQWNAAVSALPMTNPFNAALKLGSIGIDRLRIKKREEERKKREAEAKK